MIASWNEVCKIAYGRPRFQQPQDQITFIFIRPFTITFPQQTVGG